MALFGRLTPRPVRVQFVPVPVHNQYLLSCLKPSCRCHSVMPSWYWRANMGFQAGRAWLKK